MPRSSVFSSREYRGIRAFDILVLKAGNSQRTTALSETLVKALKEALEKLYTRPLSSHALSAHQCQHQEPRVQAPRPCDDELA